MIQYFSWRRIGFTMMELLVAVIIVAVLAAIAMPVYNKTVDEAHKKEAITILNTIRSAELMYKIDNDAYYDSTTGSVTFGSDSDGDNARSTLNIDVYNNDDWVYSVGGVSGSGAAAAATATAVRQRGSHANDLIIINIPDGDDTLSTW